MMRRWLLWTLLLPLFCAGFGVGARAQADLGSCQATKTDIDFGKNIDILKGVVIDGVGLVTVSCTLTDKNTSKVLVCIGASNTVSTPFITGTDASNKGAPLNYQIYTSANHDAALGMASSPNAIRALITSNNAALSVTKYFYAQIFPNQKSSPVGGYKGSFSPDVKYLIFKTNVAAQPECDTAANMTSLMAQLNVTAGITAQCSISNIRDMVFPAQKIFTQDVNDVQPAQFTVICTTNAPYAIGLDDGLNASKGQCSSASQRCMVSKQNAAHRIDYDLYHLSERSLRWGATDPLAGSPTGKPRNGKSDGETITVFGKIPKPTPSPAPGEYSDTITVTVTY